MGGYGSGRPRHHGVIERRLRLDVRTCRRRGWLVGSAGGVLRWSEDGEETASLVYQIADGTLILDYQTKDDDGKPVPIQINVNITSAACRFGGYRNYWRCPRCWRRCEILAAGWSGHVWACRQCLRPRYACQGLSPADRVQARAHKILARLDGDSDYARKPKWMRWGTFNRLVDRAQELDATADLLFATRSRWAARPS